MPGDTALDLGPIRVPTFSCSDVWVLRAASQLRHSDPDMYRLGLATSGSMWVSQQGVESGLRSGEMALWDTSRPYEAAPP